MDCVDIFFAITSLMGMVMFVVIEIWFYIKSHEIYGGPHFLVDWKNWLMNKFKGIKNGK